MIAFASFGLNVRGINYDELAGGQPFGSDENTKLNSVVLWPPGLFSPRSDTRPRQKSDEELQSTKMLPGKT